MVKICSVSAIAKIIESHSLDKLLSDLIQELKKDFARWSDFDKRPRSSFGNDDGVLELMPISDQELFSYKYVNAHPKNPFDNKQTVTAIGQLSNMSDGYPILISEMTLLTALRTAATAALATDLLSKKDSSVLSLIGTGAQSDFQAVATRLVRPIKTIKFYDIDQNAMQKFQKNMSHYDFELIPCKSHEEAVEGSSIITVCTAARKHEIVIKDEWVKKGMHINGLGGDCPGKTELDKKTLERSKVIVELFEQSFIEGDIQLFATKGEAKKAVHAELWQLINNLKSKRESSDEITVFDSVGFAIEDLSVLKMIYNMSNKYNIGQNIDMIPNITDPKNLFSVLNKSYKT